MNGGARHIPLVNFSNNEIVRAISLLGILVTAFIALCTGLIIYGGWRITVPTIFVSLNDYGIGYMSLRLRNFVDGLGIVPPDWMVYSLPQGLWVFSYTLIIGIIWNGAPKLLQWIWMSTAIILAIGWETLQYLNVLSGSFCWMDLSLGLAGFGLAMLLINKILFHEK